MKDDIKESEKLKQLEIIVSDIQSAHWGGYRVSFVDEEIETLNWALQKLKYKDNFVR